MVSSSPTAYAGPCFCEKRTPSRVSRPPRLRFLPPPLLDLPLDDVVVRLPARKDVVIFQLAELALMDEAQPQGDLARHRVRIEMENIVVACVVIPRHDIRGSSGGEGCQAEEVYYCSDLHGVKKPGGAAQESGSPGEGIEGEVGQTVEKSGRSRSGLMGVRGEGDSQGVGDKEGFGVLGVLR